VFEIPVDLSEAQRLVVQAAYDVFRESGRWAVVDAIDHLADERWEIDAYEVLRSLPPSVALLDRYHLRGDQPVKLRVRAIANCDGSQNDLDLFVRATRWLAEKERGFRPTTPHAAEQLRVTSEQFRADLASEGIHLDALAISKVYPLADVERLTWGGTYNIEGDPARWEITLSRDIRPFRRVETLPDFLEIRDRIDAPESAIGETELAAPPDPPASDAERAVDTRSYVFIAMPFETEWAASVHQRIDLACAHVQRAGIPLRWERADQIAHPGRITEQIRDALTVADLVIADISDLNPNVIYELGYADAGQTPLLLLSQDPAASPFDLKDIRQIKYSLDALHLVEQPLIEQLQNALGKDVK
jgi:hypothetical protein